jgi:hypothetical protein
MLYFFRKMEFSNKFASRVSVTVTTPGAMTQKVGGIISKTEILRVSN